MGFDLYFAGSRTPGADDWLAANKCCRLFSQLNDKKAIAAWNEYEVRGKLFVDSGAHSAHTQGIEIPVDDYIQYVNDLDEYISIFAQLDKIPGMYRKPKTIEDWVTAPELSWKNYLYMRERVKSPDKLIPVFHQGENFKWLNTMLETTFEGGKHIPYIGLSPRGDVSVKDKRAFIDKSFNIILKSSNPRVKVHAFGMTSLDVLEMFPFYSADSTTWLLIAAMGQILTPWGLIYVSSKGTADPLHIKNQPVLARDKILSYIKDKGFTLDQIQEDYAARMLVNAMYLKNWADNYVYKGTKPAKKSLF